MTATTLQRRFTGPRADRPPDPGGRCHTAVVTVRGDLDASSIDDFGRVLDDAFSTCCRGVVIDLAEADFVSIGAATRLVDAGRRAYRLRLRFALVSGSPALDHVLVVTGIRPLFSCHRTLRSALACTDGSGKVGV
ncbi:STAS domain-containing protein [Rhodococcus kronopolitis]|uniref:STAS domain-containing protein n=1 Tax=Rhodococcus kronopolitis TaxID=1460226 RepID=A0ABV9FQM8_9NOCA